MTTPKTIEVPEGWIRVEDKSPIAPCRMRNDSTVWVAHNQLSVDIAYCARWWQPLNKDTQAMSPDIAELLSDCLRILNSCAVDLGELTPEGERVVDRIIAAITKPQTTCGE